MRSLLLCLLLTIPALAQDAAPDPYATLITIQKNGKITLRLDGLNRSVTRADLTAVLTAAGNPAGRTVYIKANPSLPFATVQDTLDRVKQAGITKVEIVQHFAQIAPYLCHAPLFVIPKGTAVDLLLPARPRIH